MARCRRCGADVTFVQLDDGETLALEVYGTTMGPRFLIEDFSTEPWTASRLDPTSAFEGHPDHREACPARP